ncbi:MAG TPA: 16S rRNA (uracil(1498)-N(3))-methyltransferase [Burkholderiales bacterium]|nr:16S rRNA (uracil(1498)-N(3))-methyltransferase [Burkholderiales bacterium]
MVARLYVDAPLRAGSGCTLPEDAAHHALHVLRLRVGDEVTVFNGRGGEYGGRIASLQKRSSLVDVLEYRPIERESPLRVVLIQGVSSGERMDFTIRKAVELGVAEVRPVIAAASVARPKGERAAGRREHWQRVAISACEQCGRNRIPEIEGVGSIQEALRGERFNILLSPRAELRFSEVARKAEAEMVLAAGPEAGFSAAEEGQLARAGFVAAKLGPRVLRTETAALAALAALNALRGDF